ncbi:MAG: hypothetical protein KAW47_10980, partial [Thermoplasmatales archaeon]|nr:hypothetical protein [Thermoplasmatales archaeon]
TSLAYNESYITENHPEWILTDDEGEMQKYFPFEDWGWAIDCTNPEVIEYFTGVASYYVEEFDIDGWRVDSPQNNYDWRKVSGDHSRLDLLRSVKSAITNTKPDAILMAEISGPTFIWGENDKNEVPLFDEMCEISYNYEFCGFMGGNFLFGYNYVLPNGSNMEELEETILNKIVHNTATSKEFADFVNNQLILHNRLRANFIENHDTSRVSEAFPKQQKALFVLVATMPGIPVIHAGQENAKIKNSDYYSNVASCNTGILGLEDFYIKILKIRSENEALRCGNLIDVWDNGDNTIAFVRHYNDNNAIVGLNFGSKTATSTLNIPIEELDIDPNEKYILFDEFKDVIIGEFIGADLENLDIEIDTYGYRIITIHVEE